MALLADLLVGEEQALWRLAEAANAPEAVAMLQDAVTVEPRRELLTVLALQNAGRHGEAQKRLNSVDQSGTDALARWARAERVYAERKRAVRTDAPKGLDLAAIDPSEPVAALIDARLRLALGLVETRASRYDEATTHLNAALEGMEAIGSRAGIAVVCSDLARLHVWRGDIAAAEAHANKAFELWKEIGAPGPAADLWHDYGYLQLNTGEAPAAVASFERAIELTADRSKAARSETGLAAALVAAGEHCRARQVAEDMIERIEDGVAAAEQEGRQAGLNAPLRNVEDDAYRRIIALRTLGEVELRQNSPARPKEERLRAAEQRLEKAVHLLGETWSRQESLCARWMGQLTVGAASKAPGGDPKQFEKLELLKLELLIQAERRPGEAGRHLDRIAEVFALRGEYLEELKTRLESSTAFEAAGDKGAAAAQVARALRIVTSRDARSIALASTLEHRSAILGGASLAAEPRLGAERTGDFTAVSIERAGGRLARRHSFRVRGASQAKALEVLPNLRELASRVRVLRGLPAILPPLEEPRREGEELRFEIVVEYVGGVTLADAMKRRPRTADEIRRAARVFRTLAGAVDTLWCIGLNDVRPDPALVRLMAPDEPVFLEILPLHRQTRAKESDVVTLVRQLASWLAGSKLLWKRPADLRVRGSFPFVGVYSSIFAGGARDAMPPELDQFLSEAVTNPGSLAGWRPSTLADRLQEFV